MYKYISRNDIYIYIFLYILNIYIYVGGGKSPRRIECCPRLAIISAPPYGDATDCRKRSQADGSQMPGKNELFFLQWETKSWQARKCNPYWQWLVINCQDLLVNCYDLIVNCQDLIVNC